LVVVLVIESLVRHSQMDYEDDDEDEDTGGMKIR